MSTHIFLITHQDIGHALLKTAHMTYGKLPIATRVFDICHDTDPDTVLSHLMHSIRSLNEEANILILTDLIGSTPCNVAMRLKTFSNVKIISGLNLPMLLKILNYPNAQLHELVEKAIDGGQQGIQIVSDQF